MHVTCTDDVRARRLSTRADLTQMSETTRTWRFDRIEPDWTLDNSTDGHPRLHADVETFLEGWWT